MEYVYAAMLLHKAGKEINEENVTQVLTVTGINVEKVRVQALVASLKDVNIDEAIKTASTMMAAPVVQEAPKPEKEEEKKEDQQAKEETAMEGLGALFG